VLDPIVPWAAGFFDGEGCVLVVQLSTGSLRVGIDVTQIDRRPLDALAERWGGRVGSFDRKRVGTRVAHKWRLHGREAQAFLADVLPFLRVKRAVALLALSFPMPAYTRGGDRLRPEITAERERIRIEVRALNRRGV
jgi:hypothetical protein